MHDVLCEQHFMNDNISMIQAKVYLQRFFVAHFLHDLWNCKKLCNNMRSYIMVFKIIKMDIVL